MSKKVIIIGSGIAGLALSVRLKVKGYDVHVFEKNESYGGKLSEFKLGEYRYDFGPKLFTLPELLIDLFKISNHNIDDYIKYKKIEVGCKYFWEDGKVFNAFSDKQKLIKEIVSEFDTDKKKLSNYLNKSKKKFDLTRTIFLEKSLHKTSTFFSVSAFKAILNFFRLDISKPLNQLNEEAFDDKRLVQLFNRFATYNGSNPYVTSGIMSMIQHLEHDLGVFMPTNGLSDISKSIYNLANDLGVTFSFNSNIEKIITDKNKAIGVEKNKQKYLADIVVSNMDAKRTFTKCMDKDDLPPGIYEKAKNFKIRGSSGKVNIALSGLPKFNNVADNRYINRGGQGFVGSMETLERAYDCWKHGRWSDDPFIESVIPSAWDPTVAPPGQHWMSNFIQYCPPQLADGPWTPEKRDAFGQTVIDKIERYSPGFKNLIIHMEVRTPHEIEAEVGLTEGNIFQGELTIDQLLFNRPFPGYAQYRMPIKNMYMCGSSTHPGGGVSSACGANAAREILIDLKRPNTVPEDDFYDE